MCKKPAQRKEPITTESIQKVYTLIGRDTANLLDLRNYVIILLGFAGFLRFNEITNIRRSNVEFSTTFLKIFITKSKTDVYRDGKWSYIAKSNSSLCPVSTYTKADIPSNSGPEITAIERTSAMEFNRQILAGATVRFENMADSQSELELTDARFWREQQWTLASRTVCLFCWFCREAAISACLPVV